MTPTLYRAVIFDLDGTLVDSYEALTEAVNHARRAHSMSGLSRAEIQQFVGEGVETLLQRVFAPCQVPATARLLFESRYDEICCEHSTILEEVEPTLQEMADANIRMAVCTNKPTSFSRKILESLGLARHFDAIAGPDIAGARKPDSRHVLFTLEPTGVPAGESIFVGDMPIDVAAARASGMDVAVIASGSSSARVLREAGPDYFLNRFSELLEVVRHGAPVA